MVWNEQKVSAALTQSLYMCRVMVQGPGPSARYAHTLALVANRFLVAMGGNDGKQTLSDAWALDTSDKPYQWRKITDAGETPSPRSAQCSCCQAAPVSTPKYAAMASLMSLVLLQMMEATIRRTSQVGLKSPR